MKRLVLILRALFMATLFLSTGMLRAAEPGVYLLFVWGTLDENTRPCVEISRKKIEAAFVEDQSDYARAAEQEWLLNTAGGLVSLNPYIKRKITLEGDEATNVNIRDACLELANAAGPNDAVMVYILCHGAAIKGVDGKSRHGLAPIATSANDLQMNRHGIARGTIMKAIKSKPHRLDVLITDSCSTTHKFAPRDCVRELMHRHSDQYLELFLLQAQGSLNVDSHRPETPLNSGERTKGLICDDVPSDSEKRDAYERYAGTVFTNAFLQLAESDYFIPETDLTPEKFFEKLRERTTHQSKLTEAYLKETNQIWLLDKFCCQETQTPTRYDDDSVAFPDDLQYQPNRESAIGDFDF